MSTSTLIAVPLTAEAFAPFGDVIEVNAANEQFPINYGRTIRHHGLARAQLSGPDDEVLISIFRSEVTQLPFEATVMERHPKGSQAFFPLDKNPYLVAVAPPGEFDPRRIKLFLAQGHQGVNYHRGTWHHYSLALKTVSDFLVIDRSGPGDNCDEVTLSTPLRFAVTSSQ